MEITDIKCGLFSKHLTQQHGDCKKPRENDNQIYIKNMFSSYPMEEKTFAEASCINDTHT